MHRKRRRDPSHLRQGAQPVFQGDLGLESKQPARSIHVGLITRRRLKRRLLVKFNRQVDNSADEAGKILKPPFEFRQHGQCGRWVSSLLPHLAGCV